MATFERARSIASYPLTQLSESDADEQEAGLHLLPSSLRGVAPEALGAVPLLRVMLELLLQGRFLHASALWHAVPSGEGSQDFISQTHALQKAQIVCPSQSTILSCR